MRHMSNKYSVEEYGIVVLFIGIIDCFKSTRSSNSQFFKFVIWLISLYVLSKHHMKNKLWRTISDKFRDINTISGGQWHVTTNVKDVNNTKIKVITFIMQLG